MEIAELDKKRTSIQEKRNRINHEIVGRLLVLGLIGLLIAFSYL